MSVRVKLKGVRVVDIEKLRDIIWSPRTLIQNPYYQQDMVGWLRTIGDKYPDLDTSKTFYGKQSLRFPTGELCSVRQFFSIPIGVDWLVSLSFHLLSLTTATDVLLISVYYVDTPAPENTLFKVTEADTWEKKNVGLTAGKKIYGLVIGHLSDYPTCWIDAWMSVF